MWPDPSIERTFQRPLRGLGPPLMSNVRVQEQIKRIFPAAPRDKCEIVS
jgi:hypothetical protein